MPSSRKTEKGICGDTEGLKTCRKFGMSCSRGVRGMQFMLSGMWKGEGLPRYEPQAQLQGQTCYTCEALDHFLQRRLSK